MCELSIELNYDLYRKFVRESFKLATNVMLGPFSVEFYGRGTSDGWTLKNVLVCSQHITMFTSKGSTFACSVDLYEDDVSMEK